ncbi:unnamed protein product [Clavelina lepadiformis]|uniref:Uncharacterized protein n=1 Tax=Clavelina lepadiformis TaxID=159417 RepID=A0ABP0H3U3_CLALP
MIITLRESPVLGIDSKATFWECNISVEKQIDGKVLEAETSGTTGVNIRQELSHSSSESTFSPIHVLFPPARKEQNESLAFVRSYGLEQLPRMVECGLILTPPVALSLQVPRLSLQAQAPMASVLWNSLQKIVDGGSSSHLRIERQF